MKFSSLAELELLCQEQQLPISAIMINEQMAESGKSKQEIVSQMTEYYGVMKEAVRRGIEEDTVSKSGLVGGDAKRLAQWNASQQAMLGNHTANALAYALAVSEVNATMGRVVATPTAGSCGIIPGVFISAQEQYGWDDEHLVNGLFAAGAIGYVIANRSFVSGAEGGCQAEIGSAIGMAAGALTELRGGTVSQSIHATGLALKNTLGLICDPVAGLVEVPCIVRNGFGAISAIVASDMAMAGVRSVIPSDEVIGVMKEVGDAMPDMYRETAKGGLAATKTGKKLLENLHNKEKE